MPCGRGDLLTGWLRTHAAGARVEEAWAPNRAAVAEILEYLEGKRTDFDLELDLRATPFQLAVYEQLQSIPYGETRSYAEIARAMDRPKAVRAVGAANGANPIPLIVPCHRVIGADGSLTGFGGGVDLKAQLLAMESNRPDPGRLL